MKIKCEMIIKDFFQLSTGHIALAGIVNPNIQEYIRACKADLYINNNKVAVIDIIGEDIFSLSNPSVKSDLRAIRTTSDIINELKVSNVSEIKLIIYE